MYMLDHSLQVKCQGQVIGAVIAETRTQAQRAAKAVVVKYEELTPILTIQVLVMGGDILTYNGWSYRAPVFTKTVYEITSILYTLLSGPVCTM